MKPSRSLFWCDPPRNLLPFEFCANTSLHGLKYIEQPKRHIFERIFWMVAFSVFLVIAVILITNIFNRFRLSPIVTVFADRPLNVNQIPFPAITLCNTNTILLQKAEQIIKDGYSGTKEALAKVSLVNRICSTSALSFNRKFAYEENGTQIPDDLLQSIKDARIQEEQEEKILNITINDFLQENSQRCSDMIRLCMWENTIINCSDVFQPIQTDFGKCCSFNMIPESLLFINENNTLDKEEDINGWANSKLGSDEAIVTKNEYIKMHYTDGYLPDRKFPRRATRAGQKNGLSILINPALDEYFCTSSVSIGVKFSVHMPTAYPDISELGNGIYPGTESIVSITPDIVRASSGLKTYELESRNCYYQDEFPLRYYKYYTQPNCLKGCLANVTFAKCGCVEYYMPKDPNEQPLCDRTKERCVAEVANSFTTNRLHGPCSTCYPTCNEIDYKSSIHVAPLRTDVNIWVDKYGVPENWSESDVSVVHFYFDQDLVFPKLRKGLYGFADLFASVGGILGFCLGFSALSLLEIMYFIFIRGPVALARKTFVSDEEQLVEKQHPTISQPEDSQLENGVIPSYASKHGPLYPAFFYREMISSAVAWQNPRPSLSKPSFNY